MKLQLMSDLHLEVNPGFMPFCAPEADVLVLAGDIGSYQAGSSLRGAAGSRDWGLARFSPQRGWPTPVVYVPGNHEFDGLDLAQTRADLAQVCADLGIVCLDEAVQTIGGVRFIGHTLWTDFDALASERAYKPRSWPDLTTRTLALRSKALHAANFYLKKFHFLQGGVPALASEVRDLGIAAQAWLRAELDKPFDGKTVVVTHFAPSLKSQDPRYGLQPGTAGFCNALDEVIPQADVWLHGHLHAPSDYRVGGCRVLSNPLGYADNNEQRQFNPALVVAV